MFSGKAHLFLAIAFAILNRQEDLEGIRYSFLMEWFDAEASLIRRYYMFYFPVDDTMELYDMKNQRTFLRRTKLDNVHLRQLHEGATLHVLGRLMTVQSFGDEFTRCRLSKIKQKTFAMVKPDAVHKMGAIIKAIYESGFTITKMKMTRMTGECACTFYQEHAEKSFFQPLVQYVTSGAVVAMELVAEDAVKKWRALIGPTDSAQARDQAPDSLRAQFGTDKTLNAVHGSDSEESARREIGCFFPPSAAEGGNASCKGPPNSATFCNTTCCVVKPHIVKNGCLGDVLQAIEEGGFVITAAQMFTMEQANAEEFYEVYKGVVPDYSAMVAQLVSGPCVALEVGSAAGSTSEPAVVAFRKLVGPSDPEMARALRPHTVRARFGLDRVANAVHCTDLPEDAQLEVEYFFKILQ